MTTAPASISAAKARVMVIQDGARLHYAIPLALQRAGLLDRVFTGWYSQPGSFEALVGHLVKLINNSRGNRMLDRYAPELDFRKIVKFPSLAWNENRARNRFTSDREFFNWASEQITDRVRRTGWKNATHLFGFIRNSHPELFRDARAAGLKTFGDQMIAPYEVEIAEERLQRQRFPDWSKSPLPPDSESWTEFERATWKHLDHITCASPYVKAGLVQQGVPAEQVSVLPYPIDAAEFLFHDRTNRKGPLIVGFVGAVGLRKGAPYFADVARRLAGKNFRFVMVGPINLSESAKVQVTQHVELVGAVPRSQVKEWLQKFDVYFFPTTCEGSAGSVMEAMATGLPVVTSPNAGSLVEPGVTGFVHDYSEIENFAVALERLATDPERRLALGQGARQAAEACSLDNFGRQWLEMLSKLP